MTNWSVSGVTFPMEVIQRIAFNLSWKEIVTCSLVCKLWSRAIGTAADDFWKTLCERDFSVLGSLITDHKQLYRQLHRLRSSLLINPQPITLKGLKTHNLQILCISSEKPKN